MVSTIFAILVSVLGAIICGVRGFVSDGIFETIIFLVFAAFDLLIASIFIEKLIGLVR